MEVALGQLLWGGVQVALRGAEQALGWEQVQAPEWEQAQEGSPWGPWGPWGAFLAESQWQQAPTMTPGKESQGLFQLLCEPQDLWIHQSRQNREDESFPLECAWENP